MTKKQTPADTSTKTPTNTQTDAPKKRGRKPKAVSTSKGMPNDDPDAIQKKPAGKKTAPVKEKEEKVQEVDALPKIK